MIRKLLRRVFKKPARTPHHASTKAGKVAELPVSVHGIRREQVSSAARRTCDTLQQAGFKAYVVGGAVRDLLIGVTPKDYDVATDATPDEVRALFRRAIADRIADLTRQIVLCR